MKVLVVVSGNHGRVAPFVAEQAEALRQAGCEIELFKVEGHGASGYLRNLRRLKDAIGQFQPDVLHAHYGLCGLLCTLQHRVPVVVTYHGSDINDSRILPLSRMAMRRAAHNIFVSEKTKAIAVRHSSSVNKRSSVIPCGINLGDFPIVDRIEARQRMGLLSNGRYVLFAGAFDNAVKNATLAKAACALLPDVSLLELRGYNRNEVAMLMNAVDALLMTSHSEGSPQVIKEAMACGCPIVSVDVGDVAEMIGNTEAGTICANTPDALSAALKPILDNPRRTNGRSMVTDNRLDNSAVAQRLIKLYSSI